MLHCWSEIPDERPKFSELHKVFDKFLGIHIQDRYPYIEIQNQPYRFDRLVPETGQGTESEEKGPGGEEQAPINLSDEEEEDEGMGKELSLTMEL